MTADSVKIGARRSCAAVFLLVLSVAVGMGTEKGSEAKPWPEHVERNVEGWTVHVDKRLLEAEKALGNEALRILAFKLYAITCRVPPDRVAKLKEVPIWLDFEHELKTMQYHPSKGWLKNNGYDPRMEKSVHIPRARGLLRVMKVNKQPWVILHELAHAYHDRELGFNHAGIMTAYKDARASGKYEKALIFTGQKGPHYGMTDHKEYFAENTEAFFGVNDFYPFVRAELREHDPKMFELVKTVWGVK